MYIENDGGLQAAGQVFGGQRQAGLVLSNQAG